MKDFKNLVGVFKELNDLLTSKQKRMAIVVCIMTLIGGLFETIGIAAFLPFISVLLNIEEIKKNYYVSKIAVLFNISNNSELLLFSAILIVAIYLVKNIYLSFLTYIQSAFVTKIKCELSELLFDNYLKKAYIDFIDLNSSEIMRELNGDIISVAELLECIFKIFSLVFMISGIGLFLIIQEPGMAFGILIIAVILFSAIVLSTKRFTKKLGERKRDIEKDAYKCAYQAISGIKEISVLKRQQFFLNQYVFSMKRKKKVDINYSCIISLPDRLIETGFIVGVMVILSSKIVLGEVSEEFILNLSVFAVGAMRIIPSLSTLSTRTTQLIYLRPALKGVMKNVYEARENEKQRNKMDEKNSAIHLDFKKNIYLKNISWKYPGSNRIILEQVSLKIEKGTAVAFVGKSGGGKTTLADIVLGLLMPQKGEVLIDDINMSSVANIGEIIGYVPQSVYLLDDSIRNNVSFGIDEEDISDEKVWFALEKAQLQTYVSSLPQKIDTIVGERGVKLSGGQRQRLAIARALYQDPDVLIFDEATAALDVETEEALMDAINGLKGEKTLIIIAHRLNTIRQCDIVYEIGNGQVIKKDYNKVIN